MNTSSYHENNTFNQRHYIALKKLDYYTEISLNRIWQEWIEACKTQHITGLTIKDCDTENTNN